MKAITFNQARALFQRRELWGYGFRAAQRPGWHLVFNFTREGHYLLIDDQGSRAPIRFGTKREAQQLATMIGFPPCELHPSDRLDDPGRSAQEDDQAREAYRQIEKPPPSLRSGAGSSGFAEPRSAKGGEQPQVQRPWVDFDRPYRTQAARATAIAALLNMPHHRERTEAAFIGPPTPLRRGVDTMDQLSAEQRTPEAIEQRHRRSIP